MNTSAIAKAAQLAGMNQVAQQISTEIKEYLVVAEIEQTKRAHIQSDCKIELAKIAAMRSVLEQCLDRSFDERRRNFEELFAIIKESMQRGDNHSLERSLAVVVELARTSPLAEAKSLTSLRSAMDDPDHEFNL